MPNGHRRTVAELRYEVQEARRTGITCERDFLQLLEVAEELLSHVDELAAFRQARGIAKQS